MKVDQNLLEQVIEISIEAGKAILEVYDRSDEIEHSAKADSSPVTEADLAAHKIMHPSLEAIDEHVPVLSEEASLPPFDQRSQWERYWIIDPLDGTKEFIKKNGEFTVNIALVENGVPILGVVHVPVLNITYSGIAGKGAFKRQDDSNDEIKTRTVASGDSASVCVVASRSHGSEAVENCIGKLEQRFASVERRSMGSSLKLCLVAEGVADLYPRLAPTSEWDTAAAQAVVEAAGGVVVDSDLLPLRYNQKEEILNPHFYVIGDQSFDWNTLLKP